MMMRMILTMTLMMMVIMIMMFIMMIMLMMEIIMTMMPAGTHPPDDQLADPAALWTSAVIPLPQPPASHWLSTGFMLC